AADLGGQPGRCGTDDAPAVAGERQPRAGEEPAIVGIEGEELAKKLQGGGRRRTERLGIRGYRRRTHHLHTNALGIGNLAAGPIGLATRPAGVSGSGPARGADYPRSWLSTLAIESLMNSFCFLSCWISRSSDRGSLTRSP